MLCSEGPKAPFRSKAPYTLLSGYMKNTPSQGQHKIALLGQCFSVGSAAARLKSVIRQKENSLVKISGTEDFSDAILVGLEPTFS